MKKIGTYHDNTIDADYVLYSTDVLEIRDLMKKAYAKMDITDFNQFNYESGFGEYAHHKQKSRVSADMMFHNNFLVTQGLDTSEPWLVDGFNRLFVLDAADETQTVFIKDYSKELPVRKIVWLLYQLNYWKKARGKMYNMLDRGFCLYTYLRTGVNIAQSPKNLESDFFTLISRYTDADYKRDYDGHSPQTYSQDSRILLQNDRFFDDVKLITQLHCIKVKNKNREGDATTPISFHSIIAQLRHLQIDGGKSWEIDPKVMTKFVSSDENVIKLTAEFFDKKLSNGRSSARRAVTDYVMTKYIVPTILGEQIGKTALEIRDEKRKILEQEKRKYRRLKGISELKSGNTYYELANKNDELVTIPYVFVKEVSKNTTRRRMGGLIEPVVDLSYIFKDEKGEERTFNKSYLEYRGPFKFFEKK